MSVIVAERLFISAPEVIFWVGVPAALWAFSIGRGVYLGKWRLFSFGAAVLVGGIGLISGIGGLTTEISDDGGFGAYGAAIGAAFGILVGAGLLLVGALIGFVALFLRPPPWSQSKSEDWVDSNGPENQVERVGW